MITDEYESFLSEVSDYMTNISLHIFHSSAVMSRQFEVPSLSWVVRHVTFSIDQ